MGKVLNAAEKMRRDIDTMRESIRISWQEHAAALSPTERKEIRTSVNALIETLRSLLEEKDATKSAKRS